MSFFQAEDVIRDIGVTGVQTCALPIWAGAEPGTVVGHENLGVVEEVGAGATALEQGDRVVMPFTVACGFCRNCRAGSSGSCLTVTPAGRAGKIGRAHV